MKYELTIDHPIPLLEGTNLIIGLFDGVHIGHQELIQEASQNASFCACLTFSQGLKGAVNKKGNGLLLTDEEKIEVLASFGVKDTYVLPFDQKTLSTSVVGFLSFLSAMHPKRIVVGEDFTFGSKASGKAKDLLALKEKGIDVTILPLFLFEGEKISSTRIRNSLENGNLSLSTSLLGYPYFYKGIVKEGKHNGKGFGFPTANISLPKDKVKLPFGVYETIVTIDGKRYLGMTNIGNHPTVDALENAIVETNIFGLEESLYGKEIQVGFVRYLRPQQKFDSLESLIQQLTKDKETCLNDEGVKKYL